MFFKVTFTIRASRVLKWIHELKEQFLDAVSIKYVGLEYCYTKAKWIHEVKKYVAPLAFGIMPVCSLYLARMRSAGTLLWPLVDGVGVEERVGQDSFNMPALCPSDLKDSSRAILFKVVLLTSFFYHGGDERSVEGFV
jgi:hypothetical protein